MGELNHGRPSRGTECSRYVVAVLVATGLVAATVTAAARVATGPERTADSVAALAAPAAVPGLFLAIAVGHTRMARCRTRPDHARLHSRGSAGSL